MGATGIVNALDARTGARIWTRDAKRDTGATAAGLGVRGVAAGRRRSSRDGGVGTSCRVRSRERHATLDAEDDGGGYSSPHLATLAGVPQILMMNGGGITSVGLDGTVLWANHAEDGIGDRPATGARRRQRAGGIGRSAARPRRAPPRGVARRRRQLEGRGALDVAWAEAVLQRLRRPQGHAYGFDGTILSAINLETGERVWKGGRYGAGQMLLLPEQDLLLVVSEEGDLVLVAASADQHTEIAKFKAIEGKTWNHPVLVGDVLLVRNGEEMAAFRLPR